MMTRERGRVVHEESEIDDDDMAMRANERKGQQSAGVTNTRNLAHGTIMY